MNYRKIKKRYLFWLLSIIFCGFFMTGITNAFVRKDINLDKSEYVEKTARVMATNVSESYIIIAEETYWVVEFKFKGELRRTVMKDVDGKNLELKAFNAGDLVNVQAAKLKDGTLIMMNLKKVKPSN